jgi:hypothetical protein
MRYPCDLAISAVASDGAFVAEVSTELADQLSIPAQWDGESGAAGADRGSLVRADHSRVALVLHHHLWLHDSQMVSDAAALRARDSGRGGSVCVLALDDSPVATWLARAPRYDLRESGRAGVAKFVVSTVAATGGVVKPQSHLGDGPLTSSLDVPTPFLGQPRAHSALRRELDGIVDLLREQREREHDERPSAPFDLHVLPNRVVAYFDNVAVSFSWVPGRRGTVSDGRLLVIAWRDVNSALPRVPSLKAALPFYEREYVPDGDAPAEWRWRTADRARQPYASSQLVADWVARAGIARLA